MTTRTAIGAGVSPLAKKWRVASSIVTALAALFLAFDTVISAEASARNAGTTQLGYPAESVIWIGLIELGARTVSYGHPCWGALDGVFGWRNRDSRVSVVRC
jgi:hypothetical protein